MLEPIRAPDLVTRVAERVRKAILDGTLSPGDRLVEEQVATSLDVSRAPVREALRVLEHDGLVTPSTRRGRFVAQLSATDAWEIYSLRENLEAMAFSLLAGNVPSVLVDQSEQLLARMSSAVDDEDRSTLSVLDVAFHRLVVEHSNHHRLLRMWDSMANQIALLSREVVLNLYSDLHEVVGRHRQLVEALLVGDADLARRTIHDHIDSVAIRIVARLEEAAAEDELADGQQTKE